MACKPLACFRCKGKLPAAGQGPGFTPHHRYNYRAHLAVSRLMIAGENSSRNGRREVQVMPYFSLVPIVVGLFAQGFAQSQTQSPSASPAGPTVLDGTSALSFPPRTAESSALSPLTWGVVSFSVNESDPTCGPGRWSLTQLTLPLSQVTVPVVNIQVQLYTSNVGVRGSTCITGLERIYAYPHSSCSLRQASQ